MKWLLFSHQLHLRLVFLVYALFAVVAASFVYVIDLFFMFTNCAEYREEGLLRLFWE